MTAQDPIRVMIVDDSAVVRAVLARMIAAASDFQVVAEASSAPQALELLSTAKPDIILLDVEMPGTSGIDALPEFVRRGQGAQVIIISSLCEGGAAAHVRALGLGAADTLPKPGAAYFRGRFSEVLIERMRNLGRAEWQESSPPPPLPGSPALELRTAPEGKLGCLALGASTGGLHALSEFLRALPGEIGAPILITQHLPADFMSFFARQIETASGRRSTVAEDGRPLEADRIYIAPGGAHLGLRRCGGQIVIALDERQGGTGCMPSVDTMLSSVSQIYGRNCAAIIFSGMGRDGLAGSTELASRGGTIFVQSADSSAVWGMPRAVAEAGLASAILSPVELARRVIDYARDGSWK